MAKDLSGSVRKLTLDGVTYNVAGDANFNEVEGLFENDTVVHSGGNSRKVTRRAAVRENVTIICNGAEFDQLKALSERLEDFPMSYETASGDVYRTTGWINLEHRETEENRVSMKLFPRKQWSAFLG
jgi:formate dehydrogenase assembly factor FdhD